MEGGRIGERGMGRDRWVAEDRKRHRDDREQ